MTSSKVVDEHSGQNGLANAHPGNYCITETNLGEPCDLRVITIGAGAAGLNLAYQINRHMQHVTHIIYEKNPEVGGTWYENKYPGCACDIPSHNYQFTWEPNPEWNHLYVIVHIDHHLCVVPTQKLKLFAGS